MQHFYMRTQLADHPVVPACGPSPPPNLLQPPSPQVLVNCPLRRQRLKPEAKLSSVLTSLRPKEALIEPLLDSRDSLPGGRVAYRLLLSYGFNITEGGKYKAAVPLTNG